MPNKDIGFIFEAYANSQNAATTSAIPASPMTPSITNTTVKAPSGSQEENETKPTSSSQDNGCVSRLKSMGMDVKEWNVPGMGKQLQITMVNDKGPSKGGTLYVPHNMPVDSIIKAIEQKRRYFQQ
jgi:hypothetical protein